MISSPLLSPTGLTSYTPPHRSHIIRLVSVALSLTLFYVVFTSTTVPIGWRLPSHYQQHHHQLLNDSSLSTQRSQRATATGAIIGTALPLPASPAHSSSHTSLADVQKAEVAEVAAAKDVLTKALEAEEEAAKKAKEEAKEQPKHDKPVYYSIQNGQRYDIDQAIREILDLAPDEIYTRDLLRPITNAGEKRMREVGLRARLFKKYFAAWEDLHVVSVGKNGGALVRDDIVQYLRDTPSLSAISSLPRAEIMRTYELYRTFLTQFAAILFPWTAPYFSDHITLHAHSYNAGRGIVISGFDAVAPYIATAVTSFRQMGCELPVEVFYLGDDDLGDESREILEAIPGVTTRNLQQMVTDKGWEIKGFSSKAFAILMSSFREVLFLDADVIFFRDPEILFDDPAYADTGALFFRDRLVTPQYKRKFLRQILPKPVSAKARKSYYWTGESSEMQESGVIVVDKWRHFTSLLTVTRLNGPDRDDSIEGKGVYSFFYGDKETFWLGFELTGDTEYNFHQGNDGTIGTIKEYTKFMSEENKAALKESFGEMIDEPPYKGPAVEASPPKTPLKIPPGVHKVAGGDETRGKTAQKNGDSITNDQDNNGHEQHHPDSYEEHKDEEGGQSLAALGNPYGDSTDLSAHQSDQIHDGSKGSEDGQRDSLEQMIEELRDQIKASTNKQAEDGKEMEDNKSPEEGRTSEEDKTLKDDKTLEDEKTLEDNKILQDYTAPEDDVGSHSADHKQEDDHQNGANKRLTRRDDSDDYHPIETLSPPENFTIADYEALEPTTNFTMCSPQLLHLDLAGRPLWFNGWIQEDKWDHNPQVAVSKFEYFLSERREQPLRHIANNAMLDGSSSGDGLAQMAVGHPGDWQLGSHNLCCLTSDRVHKLTDDELQVLDMIVGIARDLGAVV